MRVNAEEVSANQYHNALIEAAEEGVERVQASVGCQAVSYLCSRGARGWPALIGGRERAVRARRLVRGKTAQAREKQ